MEVHSSIEFEKVVQKVRDNGWVIMKMTYGRGANYMLEIDTKPSRNEL